MVATAAPVESLVGAVAEEGALQQVSWTQNPLQQMAVGKP